MQRGSGHAKGVGYTYRRSEEGGSAMLCLDARQVLSFRARRGISGSRERYDVPKSLAALGMTRFNGKSWKTPDVALPLVLTDFANYAKIGSATPGFSPRRRVIALFRFASPLW